MSSVTEGQTPAANPMKAIGLMCAAVVGFTAIDTGAKYLSADYNTVQIVWARYGGQVFFTLFLFRPKTLIAQLSSRRPWLQISRGSALFIGTLCNFIALQYLQLTQTISIFFLAPLLVAVLAIFILGEKVGPRRWGAIVIGFLGVMIVVRPGFGGIHWAVVFSFAAVTAYAIYSIFTRMLAGVDRAETSLLYSAVVGFLLSSPFVPFFWTWPTDLFAWGVFFSMGLAAAVGHYLLILAHNYAGASVLAPFNFTSIIWMAISGFLVFGDVPGWATLVGASVVIASGLYLLYREREVKDISAKVE